MKQNESLLQQACVNWFRIQYPKYKDILFAVPNGGSRNKREALNLKMQGVTAGVADLIFLKANKYFSSLCIEMKFGQNKQSDYQKKWQEIAETHGNKYVVCRSFEEFEKEIKEYLKEV